MTNTNEQNTAVNFKYNGKTYTSYDTFYTEVVENFPHDFLNSDYNFYDLAVNDNIQNLYDLIEVLKGKKDIEDTVWKIEPLEEIHRKHTPSSLSLRLILNRVNQGYSYDEAFSELVNQ